MIKYIEGDLLKTDVDVIIHQCNCKGAMGSGVALQIKNKYPEVYDDYVYFCKSVKNSKDLLGECLISATNEGNYVANVFGQDNYYPRNIRHTDYSALEGSLNFLKNWMQGNGISTAACPYLMSSALAGGDWDGVVHPMLKNIFEKDKDIKLFIVKYNK